ncbi:NAD(P)H-dependent oxidoreductase [Amorphus coralli]|uniref:NAD(P)H-dependent oxidoreductase n=1 Tax=Amorphus coralli TaxID=340680 RepID=UPI000366BD3E|nr:NAD(P)H-dependent oxidoreductase [Amorphus coralli]
MTVLFVYCHPEPRSFNAALVQVGAEMFRGRGDTVEISDLYGEGFDPVEKRENYAQPVDAEVFAPLAEQRNAFKTETLSPDISREIARLERADLVVFQFPIWWHSVPAMLKGWFDRVFVSGGLYTSKMRYDRGYFRGKRALCSVTSGAPEPSFVSGGRGGSLDAILWSTQFSLHYMGFSVLRPHASFGIQGHGYSYASADEFSRQLEQSKTAFAERLAGLDGEEPLRFPGWEDWDDIGRPLSDTPDTKRATTC